MAERWTPSGSRWEPVPAPDEVRATTPAPEPPTQRTRARRRSPVLVVLVALLGLGGVTAGVVHERSAGAEGGSTVAPVTGPASRPGGSPEGRGSDRRDGRHHGDAGDAGAGVTR